MDLFKNKVATIGFWMIMLAGIVMISEPYHNYNLEIITAVVAGVGLGLMLGGMYKSGELKK